MEHMQGGLRKRKELKVVSISLFCFMILAIGVYFYFDLQINSESIEVDQDKKVVAVPTNQTPGPIKQEEIPTSGWMVDIKGQIKMPGTYATDDSMRVIDIILLAGGLLSNADTSVLNLSQKVTDQMVIIIYSKEEVEHFKEVKELEETVNKKCLTSQIVVNGACIEKPTDDVLPEKKLVSINNANKEELLTLPGIGSVKADAIIEYRKTNKGFKTIEELQTVSGIGEIVFESLKDYIKL